MEHLQAGEDSWEARNADLIVIPPARHAVHALADSVVLLTTVTRP
jgi:quercetin dioxygenase-like cupin family protein